MASTPAGQTEGDALPIRSEDLAKFAGMLLLMRAERDFQVKDNEVSHVSQAAFDNFEIRFAMKGQRISMTVKAAPRLRGEEHASLSWLDAPTEETEIFSYGPVETEHKDVEFEAVHLFKELPQNVMAAMARFDKAFGGPISRRLSQYGGHYRAIANGMGDAQTFIARENDEASKVHHLAS